MIDVNCVIRCHKNHSLMSWNVQKYSEKCHKFIKIVANFTAGGLYFLYMSHLMHLWTNPLHYYLSSYLHFCSLIFLICSFPLMHSLHFHYYYYPLSILSCYIKTYFSHAILQAISLLSWTRPYRVIASALQRAIKHVFVITVGFILCLIAFASWGNLVRIVSQCRWTPLLKASMYICLHICRYTRRSIDQI